MNLESIKRTVRVFWKYFVILFFVSQIVFNWSDIGWIFNYRVASEAIDNIVPSDISGKIEDESVKEDPDLKGEIIEEQIVKDNMIEIPKIDILAPIIFFDDPDESEEVLHAALDSGTVHFPSSSLPGVIGQTIILGHSAPPGWPMIKYDWVFSDLDSLVWGDKIFVYFGGGKYTYIVKEKYFLEKGEELPENELSKEGNVLILISCWPPGANINRIAVLSSSY